MNRILPLVAFDLLSLLRDRKAVVLSVILPVLLLPLMVLAQQGLARERKEATQHRIHGYVIEGNPEDTTQILAWVERGLDALPPAERPALAREEATVDSRAPRLRLTGSTPSAQEPPVLEIRHWAHREDSRTAADALLQVLEAARDLERRALEATLVPVEVQDVATAQARAGADIGPYVTLLMVMMLVLGGQVAAVDSLAGEKERGTLETLLTTPVARSDVVWAKVLVVFTVALVTTGINLANLVVLAHWKLAGVPAFLLDGITFTTVLGLAALYVPLAWLLAAVLVLVCSHAKTFKEAQLLIGALQLVFLVLAGAAVMPALELRSALLLLPVANVSLAARGLFDGTLDLGPALAVGVVQLIGGAACVRRALEVLADERIVFAGQGVAPIRGKEGLERELPWWVASAWAAIILAASLWPQADLRRQLIFNLGGCMLGTSLFLAYRHKIDLRALWALRPTPWSIYAIVLFAAAPAGVVAALGVSQLANAIVPVPTSMLEEFTLAFTESGLSLVQLLVWGAIVPGVVEELFFRGTLMAGWAPRRHPAWRCLSVALVFGLFHMAVFRIASTAFLGVLLGAVRLLSGSVGPAILWHILNNAIGLVLIVTVGDAFVIPGWGYAGAFLVVFGSLWVIGRRGALAGFVR